MPLRRSPFFEFLNRRDERGFASFMARAPVQTGWVEVAGERVEVALTRGPFVNFKRRNQIPADTDLNRQSTNPVSF